MSKKTEDHIKTVGAKWPAALAAASMSVRTNSRLVGLDKIRLPLAEQAALRATGMPGVMGFCIPSAAGGPANEIQSVVDQAFVDAVEAVRDAMSAESF